MSSVADRMDELIEQIEYHRQRYYRDDDPEITDAEYDALERELRELEAANPTLVRPHSPSFRVGAGISESHEVVAHQHPMLSLDNSYDRIELLKFVERCQTAVGHELAFSAELKIDGLSLSLVYQNGIMQRAVTRGDGKVGEVVTANARTLRSLPLHVAAWKAVAEIEVRGEVYLPRSAFKELNERRLKEELPLFANPRNAAAGTLRMLDSSEVAKRGLDIFIYQIIGSFPGMPATHFETLKAMGDLGFPINEETQVVTDPAAWEPLIENLQNRRAEFDYETDGIVVKVNDPAYYDEIGYTTKFPKWATAYKFPAEQGTTRILDITIQVGRTGVLTPVAHFEPVALAGTTVTRATLHNFDEIEKKDIRIGDWVFVEKGGDIIPKVVKVITSRREGDLQKFPLPKSCPRCGAETVRVEDQVAIRCDNLACPAQLERRIRHFAGRNAMDIQGLGKERVQQMVEAGILKDLHGIYKLNDQQLRNLERVGDKWISNLLEQIEGSKAKPFSRLLFAVGIPMVGEKVAEQLVEAFGSYEELCKASHEKIAAIHGLGEKVAEALATHLAMPSYQEAFKAFEAAGLKLEHAREVRGEQPLAEKTIVVTGTFANFSRNSITDALKALGANVTSSVTKNTDLLVAGEKAGSKLAKAESLGIEIKDEDWMLQWQN